MPGKQARAQYTQDDQGETPFRPVGIGQLGPCLPLGARPFLDSHPGREYYDIDVNIVIVVIKVEPMNKPILFSPLTLRQVEFRMLPPVEY